jgi:hypothetical protein
MKIPLWKKFDRWFNRRLKLHIKGLSAREKMVARAIAFMAFKAGRRSK